MLDFAASSPLVSPSLGLTIWTLLLFGISMFVLWKTAYPRITEALDKRQRAIEDSIDSAAKIREEADRVLEEYRDRLRESREQAQGIIDRARQAAEAHEKNATAEAKKERERLMEQTRRDIENETRRAIDQIRREVADLTVMATERVTRKTLDDDDQRRLVEETLRDLDFSSLAGDGR